MNLRKPFGILLMVGAVAGFIFSIVGLVVIWRYQPVVTQNVVDILALFDQTLTTTQDGLTIVSQAVTSTTGDVASLETTIDALAKTIHDTNPMLDSLASLTGKDFPAAIDAVQSSLASAQSSAKLIDDVLTAITSIPFLPVAAYKPDVPLNKALADVSTSLDSLGPALSTINTSLVDGKTNLGVVEDELKNISETTKGIGAALGGAQTIINQYKAVTKLLQDRVDSIQQAAPGWLIAIAIILSFVLGWLIIVQLALFSQGLEKLRGWHAAAIVAEAPPPSQPKE